MDILVVLILFVKITDNWGFDIFCLHEDSKTHQQATLQACALVNLVAQTRSNRYNKLWVATKTYQTIFNDLRNDKKIVILWSRWYNDNQEVRRQ